VSETTLCTVIANEHGVSVGTVEHLMAALRGSGIDNLLVELDGPEVPIMDGSAAPFVFLIECAGVVSQAASRRAIRVLKPVEVDDGTRRAELTPGAGCSFSFEIDFASPAVSRQEGCIHLANGAFKSDVARARTFGFLEDVEWLRQRGLALGGSLDNAIVLGETGVLNNALRFEDEFVRHKILDVIGDLSLVGHPVIGHLVAHRGGHALHTSFASKLLEETDAWRLVESEFDPSRVAAPVTIPVKSAPRLRMGSLFPHERSSTLVPYPASTPMHSVKGMSKRSGLRLMFSPGIRSMSQ
jgi:UDP-3-O-[3-hydroxymyristoyl] N-acetylglucosamine deacetylase